MGIRKYHAQKYWVKSLSTPEPKPKKPESMKFQFCSLETKITQISNIQAKIKIAPNLDTLGFDVTVLWISHF